METRIVTEKRENIDFPLIAQHNNSGLVVLFTNECVGTVLVANSEWRVGTWSDTWTSVKTYWTILNNVTIEFKS